MLYSHLYNESSCLNLSLKFCLYVLLLLCTIHATCYMFIVHRSNDNCHNNTLYIFMHTCSNSNSNSNSNCLSKILKYKIHQCLLNAVVESWPIAIHVHDRALIFQLVCIMCCCCRASCECTMANTVYPCRHSTHAAAPSRHRYSCCSAVLFGPQ